MVRPFSTITDLAAAIDAGTVDPADLTQAAVARVDALDPTLNAYVALRREAARAEAEAARSRWRDKTRRGPLDGIPVALKDNIDIADMPTGNGFANGGDLPAWRMPASDATVMRRLRAAGAIVLGKLNM